MLFHLKSCKIRLHKEFKIAPAASLSQTVSVKTVQQEQIYLLSMLKHFSFRKGDQGKLDSLLRKLTFRKSFPDMRMHS